MFMERTGEVISWAKKIQIINVNNSSRQKHSFLLFFVVNSISKIRKWQQLKKRWLPEKVHQEHPWPDWLLVFWTYIRLFSASGFQLLSENCDARTSVNCNNLHTARYTHTASNSRRKGVLTNIKFNFQNTLPGRCGKAEGGKGLACVFLVYAMKIWPSEGFWLTTQAPGVSATGCLLSQVKNDAWK